MCLQINNRYSWNILKQTIEQFQQATAWELLTPLTTALLSDCLTNSQTNNRTISASDCLGTVNASDDCAFK